MNSPRCVYCREAPLEQQEWAICMEERWREDPFEVRECTCESCGVRMHWWYFFVHLRA